MSDWTDGREIQLMRKSLKSAADLMLYVNGFINQARHIPNIPDDLSKEMCEITRDADELWVRISGLSNPKTGEAADEALEQFSKLYRENLEKHDVKSTMKLSVSL